jgi:hypothetical protein
MPTVSFDASILTDRRSVTISAAPGGYRVQTDASSQVVRPFARALAEARDYLGRFLVTAERGGAPWGLRVCVSAGCALYGPTPPGTFGGGVPVRPDELLAKIRGEYRADDGPIAALSNAIKIARAYPPESVARAA